MTASIFFHLSVKKIISGSLQEKAHAMQPAQKKFDISDGILYQTRAKLRSRWQNADQACNKQIQH